MSVNDNEWSLQWTNERQTDFILTHIPCSGTYTGGSDTNENALSMITNLKENHVDP